MGDEGPTQSGKKLNVTAEPGVQKGVYASLVSAVVAEHECTLDFVYIDPQSANEDELQGYLVSRVVVANTHLPALADLLNRQVEKLEQRGAEASQDVEQS